MPTALSNVGERKTTATITGMYTVVCPKHNELHRVLCNTICIRLSYTSLVRFNIRFCVSSLTRVVTRSNVKCFNSVTAILPFSISSLFFLKTDRSHASNTLCTKLIFVWKHVVNSVSSKRVLLFGFLTMRCV